MAAGELREYQKENNSVSMDGLPGLRAARKDMGEVLWYGDMKARLKKRNGIWQIAFVALVSALVTIITMFMLGLTTIELPTSRN